ncbi:cytochrome P450 [Rubellicoccus peritrichatus]|uniref:Cytochrome P450 n=1 Tax=Rubellicoccus peritrichatus TaxID=3080537 RepID=A0AAQ3QST6_9BACT|nr:cytochrome P450 [Puniceicoccus sp. CR14]WOO40621.1 cytochrome P450 [Puniceicoccus sp. CR14]
MPDHSDPFRKARTQEGVLNVDCDGENVPLVLRHEDAKETAKDWETFSSDNPLMCVLHSEADVRGVRQLPLEIDPPDHADFRALVQPLFNKPRSDAKFIAAIEQMIDKMVRDAVSLGEIEAVRGFVLPMQSKALALLLGMPESEADIWISWGLHVFHDRDDDAGDGHLLEQYTGSRFKQAEKEPGGDFFSYLNEVEFRGRKLTFDEKQGFANVTFAGGRDTIINTAASIFAHLAEDPDSLSFLREDESRINLAGEEFVRYVSPLTAITRKCPHMAKLAEQEVPEGGRVAICWPSANRDETVFEDPDELKLDRDPNPHIGYGFGRHNCLGAHHARLLFRSLMKSLCKHVERMVLIESEPKMEKESSYERQVGYESVHVRFFSRNA